MKSPDDARKILFSRLGPDQLTKSETINTEHALGRVTAEPVFARFSAPSFHSSAMDGIAVRAEETYGTTERKPTLLELGSDAVWINTGQPMPPGFNAVIMVEKIHEKDEKHLEIRSPAYPWQNVRKVGEDIVATQLLFPQHHRVRAFDLGAMVSAGVFSLKVRERPRVTIIPTGSELVHWSEIKNSDSPDPGKIVEYNSLILAGLVQECGAVAKIHNIVPDNEQEIFNALKDAVESDAHLVIINAGSSAGTKDYTMSTIEKIGEVLVHGVAMMPGKPTILGIINEKPVIGNPGYPVSSILSFDQFVSPLLYGMQGLKPPPKETLEVVPTRDIPSKLGIEEFVRVNIGKVASDYTATPLSRAAGSITTLTRAEGVLRIPALSEGVTQNERMAAELLVGRDELRDTLVIIGSHDMTIDVIGDEIRRAGSPIRIASSNVGSLGGLIALKKGTCHLAGSHLLDVQSGQYNLSYIQRYLNEIKISIFRLVLREQGLIIAKGNPKGIKGLEDLSRKDITFVNRQAGSGTRVLLDFKIKKLGVEPKDIKGYRHEEFTHMAVAVDVLSGAADCGMGIFAAAKALELDFIPIEQEQYDLVIPEAYLNQTNIQVFLETICSHSFRERVKSLGGYDPSKSGQLWMETGGG
jgi:putative molybdopterin biosynthesis protein